MLVSYWNLPEHLRKFKFIVLFVSKYCRCVGAFLSAYRFMTCLEYSMLQCALFSNSVAGMKKYVNENEISGQTLVAITSGANMDFNRLRFVSERADGSEKTLIVDIPETPGSFRTLYSLIWPRNVTEFSYRFDDLGDAHVLISFQPVANIENDFEGVVDTITENGYSCTDVSNSELTKVHIRNMAGGRSNVPDERLFRFDFPESPGALQRFLLSLDIQWNISLFHYRNHGKLRDNLFLLLLLIPLYPC